MTGWKKLAALFALSTSLGLLGVACSTQVEDGAAVPDTADPTDAPQAFGDTDSEAAAALAPSRPDPTRGRDLDRERERREYERCARRCNDRLRDCLRSSSGRDDGFGPDRDRRRHERCERERSSCASDCRR